MHPCEACKTLAGQPSTTRPHPDLAAAGVGAFGTPTNMEVLNHRWNCTVCNTWMYQNTRFGDPPDVWVMGERPANWPGRD